MFLGRRGNFLLVRPLTCSPVPRGDGGFEVVVADEADREAGSQE